jgi:hypothetical protein
VLISGAGNDAVDWQLGLKPDCTGLTAADCIDPVRSLLMDTLQGWPIALVGEVHLAYDAGAEAARHLRPRYDCAAQRPARFAARLQASGRG